MRQEDGHHASLPTSTPHSPHPIHDLRRKSTHRSADHFCGLPRALLSTHTTAGMALLCHSSYSSAWGHRAQQRQPFSSATLQRRQRCNTHLLAAVDSKQNAATVAQELMQLVSGTEKGLDTPADLQQSIMSKVEQLKAAQAGAETTSDAVLSATWKVCVREAVALKNSSSCSSWQAV